MPSPFIHAELAAHTWARLARRPRGARAAFLFGSTAPDADKLLGLARQTTHFWDTRSDVSGALKLLAAYPQLDARALSPVEQAFVAGYLCHLVADEQWTFVIYRPYFGRHSPYAAGPEGAQLQWALHGVLEAEQAAAGPMGSRLTSALARARRLHLPEPLLPFLATADLERYLAALLDLAATPAGAARSALLIELQRAHAAAPLDAPAGNGPSSAGATAFAEPGFAQRLPELQARARAYVAPEALRAFAQRAVAESVRLVDDYLAGRPLRPPLGTAALQLTETGGATERLPEASPPSPG